MFLINENETERFNQFNQNVCSLVDGWSLADQLN